MRHIRCAERGGPGSLTGAAGHEWRTLLTAVRTSLALVGFGLALLQFHPGRGGRLGHAALAGAGLGLAVRLWRFRVHRRQLAANEASTL